MKKITLQIFALALITGLAARIARADTTNTQTVPFHPLSVSSGGCPGTFTGYAYMTNNAAIMWVTPPPGTSSGTMNNLSGYNSAVCVTRSGVPIKSCDTNSVTFAATNSYSYELYLYVKTSGPTNGQPMTVQVIWH